MLKLKPTVKVKFEFYSLSVKENIKYNNRLLQLLWIFFSNFWTYLWRSSPPGRAPGCETDLWTVISTTYQRFTAVSMSISAQCGTGVKKSSAEGRHMMFTDPVWPSPDSMSTNIDCTFCNSIGCSWLTCCWKWSDVMNTFIACLHRSINQITTIDVVSKNTGFGLKLHKSKQTNRLHAIYINQSRCVPYLKPVWCH